MHMRILLFVVGALLLSLVACGGGGTGKEEVKAFLNEQIDAMQALVNGLEKATSGKEAAVAMNAYAVAMGKMKDRTAELTKKYPELRSQQEDPALRAETRRLREVATKMGSLMQKFMGDKDFIEAQTRMINSMR